jgi:carbonic anhydrase
MAALDELLANNRAWAAEVIRREPTFFQRLARQQAPRFLWIGCSDSRVPANEIVGLLPGELFVHRNVANLVVHTDLNCLSVVQYAIEVLRVEHVIVCGHYGCGGVEAASRSAPLGLIENWLRHIQDVGERHRALIEQVHTEQQRIDRLSELNVIEQVQNVCRTTIVEAAWRRGQPLTVHGLIYRIDDGLLRPLGMHVQRTEEVAPAYAKAIATIRSRAAA